MGRFTRGINQVAQLLYRGPTDPSGLNSAPDRKLKSAIFVGALLTVSGLFGYYFLDHSRAWGPSMASVSIPHEKWWIIDDARLTTQCQTDLSCKVTAIRATNDLLHWGMKLEQERKFRGTKEPGSKSWLVARVSPNLLNLAGSKSATYLGLGWFRGTYRIWIDGQELTSGTRESLDPIIVSINPERFRDPRPLEITAWVQNDFGHQHFDLFNAGDPAGLFNIESLNSYRGFHIFWSRVRPTLYAGLHLIIALFFFGIWLYLPVKEEHLLLSFFSLAGGLIQVRSVDFVFMMISRSQSLALSFIAHTALAISGALLGFAVSRMRRSIGRWVAIGAVIFVSGVLVAVKSQATLALIDAWTCNFLIPVSLIAGAASCGVQTAYLLSHSGTWLPKRLQVLTMTMIGFAVVAAIYWLKSAHFSNVIAPTYGVISYKVSNFLVVVYFSIVLMQDLRQQSMLIAKVPVSKYHRRLHLPEKIFGSVLSIDLKNSEKLFKKSNQESSMNYVGTWRSHCYMIASKLGGTVLQRKGDEIQMFFEALDTVAALKHAVDAFSNICSASRELELAMQNLNGDGDQAHTPKFRMRGSLSVGMIQPIWEATSVTGSEPYWEQWGDSTVLVDTARLLEVERTFELGANVNALVMLESHCRELEAGGWTGNGKVTPARETTLKHKNKITVIAFLPRSNEEEVVLKYVRKTA